jgi:hypothetical protein
MTPHRLRAQEQQWALCRREQLPSPGQLASAWLRHLQWQRAETLRLLLLPLVAVSAHCEGARVQPPASMVRSGSGPREAEPASGANQNVG